jgi:hypothetical protein
MLKKVTVAIVLTGLMAGAAYAGSGAGTGINGSVHDMNVWSQATASSKDGLQRTCVYCHTPHSASQTAVGATGPLWNRGDSAVVPASYSWKAPLNTVTVDPTKGPTRLCLSCHDGVVAPDSHGTNGSVSGTKFAAGSAKIVTDMTITHPIGFDYLASVTARNTGGAKELVPASIGFITAPSTVVNSVDFNTNTRGATVTTSTKPISDVLFTDGAKGIMTCASCHDVHNTTNVGSDTAGVSYNYLLRARQEGSAICLSCHVK